MNLSAGRKRRFLGYGALIVLLTNIVLQGLLLITSTWLATFVSQLVNVSLGFLLYGKRVFRVERLQKHSAVSYGLLAVVLWWLNWTGINLLSNEALSPNLAALLLVPGLAGFSYIVQKTMVFSQGPLVSTPTPNAGLLALDLQPIDNTADSGRPLLSVIVPCFNEASTILDLIERVQDATIFTKQIIIVDDGSTDGTRELLTSLEASNLTVLMHPKNRGKGAALATGFAAAQGYICIVQDADLEYDPNEYPIIINPIVQGKADVVFGSRFQGAAPHRVVYFWHRVGNGFLTLLSNMFTNINLTDMETCYKAFRTEIIQSIQIEESRFGFEPEITAKIARIGCRIYEVGISYYGRTYEEGKKIGWKDGIRAIWCILKYNTFAR
jgi:hypothetical protein